VSIDIDRGEGKLIFERVYYIARFANYRGVNHPVFARAVVDHDGQLHITGVEGPKRNGDCWGSCGQIDMGWRDDPARWTTKGANFNDEQLAEFMAIWDRWHLNHMRAGSQAQMDRLREHPITVTYPESHYDKACEALAAAGLHPDADGYRYGSAWKHEELPAEVIERLASFPASSIEPAWV
jgi:hypothetical protein